MILIAYDGSDDAKAAIEQSSKLFPGEQAAVLTVWQRFIDTMVRTGGGINLAVDYDQVDEETEKGARAKADEGAALARESGLDAVARSAVVETTTADAILAEAAAVEASAVVCGSRGYTGVKSLLLGSTSHHVLQHADLPVVVVPSPAVAAARSQHRDSLK
ncbi:MAG TPA: universal stress protein [Solirubrobacteraceae bacterium]|jgi:nucleotide-binding universal stress UspA family protein|nr:universal stress protein [Solirubrobacteraceae bacterium]